jgi:hypothetical protein
MIEILQSLGMTELEISNIFRSKIESIAKQSKNKNEIQAYLDYETFYTRFSKGDFDKYEIFSFGNKASRKDGKLLLAGYSGEMPFEHWFRQPKGTYNSKVNNCESITTKVYGCIYFLVKKGSIVYIGETQLPRMRIHGHTKKDYKSVVMIPCLFNNRKELEVQLIKHFRPKYNKAHNPDWKPPKRVKKKLKLSK